MGKNFTYACIAQACIGYLYINGTTDVDILIDTIARQMSVSKSSVKTSVTQLHRSVIIQLDGLSANLYP